MFESMKSVPEDNLGIPVEWCSIECIDAITSYAIISTFIVRSESPIISHEPQCQSGSAQGCHSGEMVDVVVYVRK